MEPGGGIAGARYNPGANRFARRIPSSTSIGKSLLIEASRATATTRISSGVTCGSSAASNMCSASQAPLTIGLGRTAKGLISTMFDARSERTSIDMSCIGQGEVVHFAYQLVRDALLFTDRRLILIDKQGITGKKTEYHSIPYRSITHFAVETAGTWDLDAELKIYMSGTAEPLVKQFTKGVDIYEVQAHMTHYVTSGR